MTNKERTIFTAFQFSSEGLAGNFLSTGSTLFALLTAPLMLPFALLFVFIVFGANLMRIYISRFSKDL